MSSSTAVAPASGPRGSKTAPPSDLLTLFPPAITVGSGYAITSPPYQGPDQGVDSVTIAYQDTKRGRLFVIDLYYCTSTTQVVTIERQLLGSMAQRARPSAVGSAGLILGPTKIASGYRADALFGQGVVLAHLTAQAAAQAGATPAFVEKLAQAEERILAKAGY